MKNYYSLKTRSEQNEDYQVKQVLKKHFSVMLIIIAIFWLITLITATVTLAQAPGDQVVPIGDPIGEAGRCVGEPVSEGVGLGDIFAGSADARDDSVASFTTGIQDNWGDAGAYAEMMIVIFAAVMVAPLGWVVFREIGGIYGAVAGVAFALVMIWAHWGIWDQLEKGHVVPAIAVVIAYLGALSNRNDYGTAGAFAALILYFSVILDPLVTKWGVWDAINVLQLSGADSWADLFGID